MGALGTSLVLALVFSVSYTYILLGDDDDEPTASIEWPGEYYFKGQTVDMHSGVVHPFRMCSSMLRSWRGSCMQKQDMEDQQLQQASNIFGNDKQVTIAADLELDSVTEEPKQISKIFETDVQGKSAAVELDPVIEYSTEYNRSRLELCDGELNSYYLADTEEQTGGLYRVITVTTKNLTNVVQCMFESSSGEQTDFLPDTEFMNITRTFELNGMEVEEWSSESYEEVFRMVDTVVVYRTEAGIHVPVTYDHKQYDMDSGKLLDHTVTEYYDSDPSVEFSDLEFDDRDECEDMGSDFETNMKFLHPASSLDVDIAFNGYKNHHKKEYNKKERTLRKTIFNQNWRLVVDHNRKNLGYKLGMNKFADRTDEELRFLTGTRPSRPDSKGTHTFHTLEEVENLVKDLPEEFDLRLKGAMRPVKQQGNCGSCWAFSSTATVEGAISYGLGGRDVDLSEQSLVDCAWGYDNLGCDGGDLDSVFKYILDKGIPADVDYGPYKEIDGICHIQNLTSTFKIRGYGKVNQNSINSMKLALYKYGPVAVSVYATRNMKLYSSGVFYDVDCEGGYVNHGVVVVGYGILHGDPYWIVRNSWGEEWGVDGHILMSAEQNNCFLLGDPYYVIV